MGKSPVRVMSFYLTPVVAKWFDSQRAAWNFTKKYHFPAALMLKALREFPRQTPNRQTGFRPAMTLVEVMISMGVFLVVLLGVLGLATYAHASANATVYHTIAAQAAQGVVEQIRGKAYGTLKNCCAGKEKLAISYFLPPMGAGASGTTKETLFVINGPLQRVDGIFVNAALDPVSLKPLSMQQMNCRMQIKMKPALDIAESEGMAIEVVYVYDVPTTGGFRTVTDVRCTFVANFSVE